jgi:hypothetical protein
MTQRARAFSILAVGAARPEMDLGFLSFVYLDEQPAAATAAASGR